LFGIQWPEVLICLAVLLLVVIASVGFRIRRG